MYSFYFFSTKNWFLTFRAFSKKWKLKGKFSGNSGKKYLQTFSHFSTISVHHKWKGITTQDLNLRKLGNFKEPPEMLGIDGQVDSQPSKRHILTVVPQNCKKSIVKHSTEKPMILYFVDLSIVFCPRLYTILDAFSEY